MGAVCVSIKEEGGTPPFLQLLSEDLSRGHWCFQIHAKVWWTHVLCASQVTLQRLEHLTCALHSVFLTFDLLPISLFICLFEMMIDSEELAVKSTRRSCTFSVVLNGDIFPNYRIISKAGYWFWRNPQSLLRVTCTHVYACVCSLCHTCGVL